jgi:hypothetical protein
VTVCELARAHGPRAIEVLAAIMDDPKATATARAMAADRILDRAYGRPPQLSTSDAGQFRRAVDLSDDELARIIAGAQPVPSLPTEPEAELLPSDAKKMN